MVSQPDQPSPTCTSNTLNVANTPRNNHHHSRQYSASVVSRPSLSRTKRYNRSHVGGLSYVPRNEFPIFAHSGDVEIVIRVGAGAGAAENRYLLHRHTLTRCSGFFEASTSLEWSKARPLLAGGKELARVGLGGDEPPAGPDADYSARLAGAGEDDAPGARTPPKKRWRYELDPGAGDGDIPMLVQKDDSATTADSQTSFPSLFGAGPGAASDTRRSQLSRSKHGRTSTSHVSFSHSVTNLSMTPRLAQVDEDLLRDYDNLFRIFYNYSPLLNGVNVADAYVQCKSLLALADQYDALAVTGPRVDHHLLQFQSRLWKQIAKYPISYLRLGYLARSKVIFQEALIHVVGQWPVGERSLRAALPGIVLDIIEDKVEELEENVSRVEGRLFRLNLTTAKGERVTPSKGFLDWLVVSLFRQWLADNTSPQPAPARPSSSGRGNNTAGTLPPLPASPLTAVGRAYRTLGSPNASAFLNHDECKKFLKLSSELYSRDNLRRFEKRMDELKSMARDVVRPLLGSGLELDMAGSSRTSDGITYLTCTAIGVRDLPWPVDG